MGGPGEGRQDVRGEKPARREVAPGGPGVALPWRLACAREGLARFDVLADVRAVELLRDLTASKAAAARVLAEGRALRADAPLGPNDRLAPGDEVCVGWGGPGSEITPATHGGDVRDGDVRGGDVRVLWEDPFALAVEKPAGLLVHSDGTGVADTLTSRVRAYLAGQGSPAAGAAQALQRLDEQTTGVVLFSKAPDFQPAFDALLAGHGTHKRYLAIVRGRLTGGAFEVDAPIARDRHDARRMRVGRTGKPSLTRVAPLETAGGRTLVACELGSGRRHQIRVHLASVGHPVAGDALYGGGAGALMLHAYQEGFVHPVTGGRVLVETSWPSRFLPAFPWREIDWGVFS